MYHQNFRNMYHTSPSSMVQGGTKSLHFYFEKMTMEEIDSSLTKMKILEGKILASLEDIVEKYVGKNSNEHISRSAKFGWNLYRL